MSSSPTSSPTPNEAKPTAEPKPKGSAATKTCLFDDGQGDYRIMAIREDGSFIFLPEVPGFESQRSARLYIRNSGDQFRGLQLAIVRFADFVAVEVQSNPVVSMNFKPRG